MHCFSLRNVYLPLTALVLSLAFVRPTHAQTRPTGAQAAAMLQARPELAAQLRERLLSSGLSADQVRARLRAEGYPDNLLDAYLPGGAAADGGAPTQSMFDAMRALGIVNAQELDGLRPLTAERGRPAMAPPVVARDSVSDSTLAPASAALFGYAIFRDASTRFEPNLDGPVDEGYRIGPGDQIVLILTGDVEVAHTLEVTRGGFVVIPQVGQIGVANLTLGQLEDLLYSRLGRVYSGVQRGDGATTQFSVNISRLRSNQVFVVGDVVTPGAFRISSAGTALTALYAAGGPTEEGSLRSVQVRRSGRTVATLDVYDYLLQGDASQDVRLQQGDVLFVPMRGARVRVDGEVMRPATYELQPGEQLADLLAAAGGLRATATGGRVLVDRIVARGSRVGTGAARTAIDIALPDDGAAPEFPMVDGDVVRVPRIADRVRNRILVSGHVWTPGPQGFTPGLTLQDALARAGGLQSDAYLGRVLVSRLLPDSTRVQLRALLRDSSGATVEPLQLQPDDEITVYSRTAFRTERYVVISGAVRNGGRFPFREGMTLRDLALQAGGLSDLAELRQAEIARRPELADENVLSTTIRVPLDSGYLFADGRTPPNGAREVPLEPFDNVLIFRDPERGEMVSVQVHGEVRLPGTYAIRTRGERLSDLIERAGGFTAQGDTSAAYFSRVTSENELVSTLVRRATGPETDSLGRVLSVSDSMGVAGEPGRIRVGVDVAEALRRRDRPDNLYLQDGDSLFIPARRQTVSVRGEVNAPTQLVATGHSLGAYLNAAGGPTPRGQESHAYVIQPNGKIESRRRLFWVFIRDPTPKPGATVVVPARGEQRPGSRLETITLITQTLTALATVVLLSRR